MNPKEEAALQRILDATTKAGGNLADSFDAPGRLRFDLRYIFFHELPTVMDVNDRARLRNRRRREQRIIKAARILQANLQSPEDIEWARRVERDNTPAPAAKEEVELMEWARHSGTLTWLVGCLAYAFEHAFQARAGYTADSDTGDVVDGPFIRFVEQTLYEFGVTVDGNRPYSRAAIAKSLTEFRRASAALRKANTAQP
jgi:hypothetical protein